MRLAERARELVDLAVSRASSPPPRPSVFGASPSRPARMNASFHLPSEVSDTPWRRAASAPVISPRRTLSTTRVLKSTERFAGLPK